MKVGTEQKMLEPNDRAHRLCINVRLYVEPCRTEHAAERSRVQLHPSLERDCEVA
jgi:hypothetical protein